MGRSRRALGPPDAYELPPPRGLEARTFAVEGDEYVVFSFPLPDLTLPEGLTAAERDVVRSVVEGRSNAQIARERGTSANTVANQLRAIYAKLDVSGRLELVQRCAAGTTCPAASAAALPVGSHGRTGRR